MTMSAIDFLDQWFETDVLKATMSASGIIGTFLGVRSPGTAYVLLHHYMGEIDGAFRAWGFARGGTGAISNAIAEAALEAGAEIRTQPPIAQILVKNDRAVGVALTMATKFTPMWFLQRRSAADVREDDRTGPPSRGISGRREALQVPRIVGQSEPGARCTARTSNAFRETALICAARFRFPPASTTWKAPTTKPSTGTIHASLHRHGDSQP